MANISFTTYVDAEEVANALASFTAPEARRFGEELADALFHEDQNVLDAFADGVKAKLKELGR